MSLGLFYLVTCNNISYLEPNNIHPPVSELSCAPRLLRQDFIVLIGEPLLTELYEHSMPMSPPLHFHLSSNIVTHDKPKFTVLSPMLFRDRFPLVIMNMVLGFRNKEAGGCGDC